jgi:hypothetical protein
VSILIGPLAELDKADIVIGDHRVDLDLAIRAGAPRL